MVLQSPLPLYEISAYRLAQIHPDLIQHLLHDLLPFLLVLQPCHVVDRIVHHLLPLVHDVVFLLELHRDALQRGQVHLPVHAAQQHGGALHRLHHLLVGSHGLDPERDGLELGSHRVEFLYVSGVFGGRGARVSEGFLGGGGGRGVLGCSLF